MRTSSTRHNRSLLPVLTAIITSLAVLVLLIISAWRMDMFGLGSLFSTDTVERPGRVAVTPGTLHREPSTPAVPVTTVNNETETPVEVISNEAIAPITVNEPEVATDEAPVDYIEVVDGCGPHFEGECVNVRSGPGTNFPVVARLRTGQVLRAGGTITVDGRVWINIMFNERLSYPERLTTDWFVAADLVKIVYDAGDRSIWSHEVIPTNKRIIVDRSEQKLYAYDGDKLFLETLISTGLELTPTPHGEFSIFLKTPSRYMQGPTPGSDQVYDLPGVPWNMYFTEDGSVIHGAYWHTNFGSPYSHGCVNVPLDIARKLYNWADLGTKVIVQE